MSDPRKVTGKVADLQAAGKWTNKKGTADEKLMFRFDLSIETDTGEENGQISFDTPEPTIKVGDTHTFNIYPPKGEYSPSIYLDKPKGSGFKGGGGRAWTPDPERESRKERWAKQIMITRQACLNTAGLLIANGAEGGATLQNIQTLAEALEIWVKRGMDLKVIAAGPVQNDAPPQATVTNDAPAAYRKPAPLADVPDPF